MADDAAGRHVPLCVKIAPDLADDDVVAVGRLAREPRPRRASIATNTTISRDGLRTPRRGGGGRRGRRPVRAGAAPPLAGGAAAAPCPRPQDRRHLGRRRHELDDARERLDAGATLVQAYTGFVYGGPLWPRRMVGGLGE